MIEPRHWHEDGATEVEKNLLRAAGVDGPRKGADLRMLAAIEAAPLPPFNPGSLAGWMKVGLAAVIAGGGGLLAHQLLRSRAHAPENPLPLAMVMPADVGAPATVASAPEIAPEPAHESPAEVPAVEASPRARRAATIVRSRIMVPENADDSLGEETKALDRIQEALEARRTPEGMRLLDDYNRRFPQGRLRPEAMVLRLAGLVQAGKNGAVQSLAHQLMADEIYRPYLPKIESLLKELGQ